MSRCTPTRPCCPSAAAPGLAGITTSRPDKGCPATVTYNMNILQSLESRRPFCVQPQSHCRHCSRAAHRPARPITIRSTRRPQWPRKSSGPRIDGVDRHPLLRGPIGVLVFTRTGSSAPWKWRGALARHCEPAIVAYMKGRVRHRRFAPVAHAFEYRIFMMYPRSSRTAQRVRRALAVVVGAAPTSLISAAPTTWARRKHPPSGLRAGNWSKTRADAIPTGRFAC